MCVILKKVNQLILLFSECILEEFNFERVGMPRTKETEKSGKQPAGHSGTFFRVKFRHHFVFTMI